MWDKVNDRITWVSLGRIRDSFLGKAITGISLAALVLGDIGKALTDVGVDLWSIELTFLGGLAFLAGYLGFSLCVPSEFRKGGDIDEIVGRLRGISDFEFFVSRRNMAKCLLADIEAGCVFGFPESARRFLRTKIGDTAYTTINELNTQTSSLYHADLNIRSYIRPFARILISLAFTLGVILLAAPTIFNILKAINTFW